MNILDIPLPQLERWQVVKRNNAILALNNRVYDIAGESFFFKDSTRLPETAVCVQMSFLGQGFKLYVDLALINTLLAPFCLRLEEMSPDAIQIFLRSQVPNLPKNVQIINLCRENRDFYTYDSCFSLISYATGQSNNWQIAFSHDEHFPIKNLVDILSPYLKGVMAHQWADLRIPMPLVVSTLHLSPSELSSLEMGDILFLEG